MMQAKGWAGLVSIIIVGALLGACASGSVRQHRASYYPDYYQEQPGVNFCEERLPAAQARIQELYSELQGSSSQRVETSVVDAHGREINVSIESNEHGKVQLENVETGLSDLLLNCGGEFTGHDCFVDIYLDGEKLLSLDAGVQGEVALRCLRAGQRQLRIESVGQTIYEGLVNFESDVEYLAELKEHGMDTLFMIYASNPISDRVPLMPSGQDTATHEAESPVFLGQ